MSEAWATSGALVEYLIQMQTALDLCNADKRALKAWADE